MTEKLLCVYFFFQKLFIDEKSYSIIAKKEPEITILFIGRVSPPMHPLFFRSWQIAVKAPTRVIHVETQEEALKIARKWPINMAICDISIESLQKTPALTVLEKIKLGLTPIKGVSFQ